MSSPRPTTPALSSPNADVSLTPVEVSPESIKPYPKAPPRSKKKGKKAGRAMSYTDEAEDMEVVRQKHLKRLKKLQQKGKRGRPRKTPLVTETSRGKSKGQAKRGRPRKNISSEEEEDMQIELQDSTEYSDEIQEDVNIENSPFQDKEPDVGDYILVPFKRDGGRFVAEILHYVCQVITCEGNILSVKYLRLSAKFGMEDTFYFPNIEDEGDIEKGKVIGVLKPPIVGATKRLQNIVRFSVPIVGYNLR